MTEGRFTDEARERFRKRSDALARSVVNECYRIMSDAKGTGVSPEYVDMAFDRIVPSGLMRSRGASRALGGILLGGAISILVAILTNCASAGTEVVVGLMSTTLAGTFFLTRSI